jgi:putative tryptophan/tyrosine transport system substrate-binding protein
MKRRAFLGLAAATLATRQAAAQAMAEIGFLHSASPDAFLHLVAAFQQGLAKMGYVEGRSIAIDYRWAHGDYETLPALARALAARHVAVIATAGGEFAARAAKQATDTIPVLTVMGRDLVAAGLVDSLSRPGGNVTGVMQFTMEMTPIRLGLLRELMPHVTRVALLVNARNPNSETQIREGEEATRNVGLGIDVLKVPIDNDLEEVFAVLDKAAPQALLVGAEPVLFNRRTVFVAGVARRGIPAVYDFREFADAGGLISYGASLQDAYQQIGIYAGRILRGARIAELPVMRSSRFELVVNLAAAKALGIAIPQSVLLRADEVIE